MENSAIQIIKILKEAGFEAYFAGGSVRDLLMGNEINDYDIASSAKPDEIEALFKKTFPIGKNFGVILAELNGHHFEIASFRSDSSFSDGRRPDAITFTNAKEDAVRRDFTINGLFYDPIKKKVFDFVDGQRDIKNKIIRFIGNPEERIKEDNLRLLRAIRFKNNFSFKYDKNTKNAIKELSHFVFDISKERIADELTKMLLHKHRSHSLKELYEFKIMDELLPELVACKNVKQPKEFHQEGDVFTHILKSLHDMPKEFVSKELVWSVLLHDIGKPMSFMEKVDRIHFDGHAELSAKMANDILRRFKFSKAFITKVVWLISHHMIISTIPKMRRAHMVDLFWNPYFEDLMKLHYCDEIGSLPIDLSLYEEIMQLYKEFKNEKLLEDHFKPILNGNDLMEIFNLEEGPNLKKILKELRYSQIDAVVKNKEEAIAFVKGFLMNK